MQKAVITFLSFILFVGCGPYYVDYFPYHNNGCRKPVVALLPVIDSSCIDLPWDLSQELTEEFHCRTMSNGMLYFLPDDQVAEDMRRSGKSTDFFGSDLCFAKNFCGTDYIVAIEILEHKWIPYVPGKISPLYPIKQGVCDSVLSIRARMKIIDIRCNVPTVIAMEVINSNHMVPRREERIDYKEYCWGIDPYKRTPYSIAHQRLIKDLVARMEQVICSRQ